MKCNYLVICAIVASLFAIGCKDVVVRDAKVYRAELEFVDAAATEQVERGKAIIEAECTCEEVVGIKGFATKECQDLAETVLTIEARMTYHTNFMRYLGGLSEKRPPKEPPPVLDTNTLCPEVSHE